MPAFDKYVLEATTVVDQQFGEDFVVRPFSTGANVNAPLAPDPTRDVVCLQGIWVTKPANPREPNEWDPRAYRRPGTDGDVAHVEFSQSALCRFAEFEIRDGDQIERLSNRTVYLARSPGFTANGTMRVPLNRLDRSP